MGQSQSEKDDKCKICFFNILFMLLILFSCRFRCFLYMQNIKRKAPAYCVSWPPLFFSWFFCFYLLLLCYVVFVVFSILRAKQEHLHIARVGHDSFFLDLCLIVLLLLFLLCFQDWELRPKKEEPAYCGSWPPLFLPTLLGFWCSSNSNLTPSVWNYICVQNVNS